MFGFDPARGPLIYENALSGPNETEKKKCSGRRDDA